MLAKNVDKARDALLKRCERNLTAFSEKEFERNIDNTYVTGCTPKHLADKAASIIKPDPKKEPYREATHLGGYGFIFNQPPEIAYERGYVDQPVCKNTMVPMDYIPTDTCQIQKLSQPRAKSIIAEKERYTANDYAPEPEIAGETPTEYRPPVHPNIPTNKGTDARILQDAIISATTSSPVYPEKFLPSDIPDAVKNSLSDIGKDLKNWKNVPGKNFFEKFKSVFLEDGRPIILILTVLVIAFIIILCLLLLKTISGRKIRV
jgi:hypothetical protein